MQVADAVQAVSAAAVPPVIFASYARRAHDGTHVEEANSHWQLASALHKADVVYLKEHEAEQNGADGVGLRRKPGDRIVQRCGGCCWLQLATLVYEHRVTH
jgi:hypothetical protein